MQIKKMRVLSPYTYNTPPGQLRPAKLEKYLARSRFKAIRSLGTSESAIQSSNSSKTGNDNCNVNIYNKTINNTKDISKKIVSYNDDQYSSNNNNTRSNGIVYLDSLDINHNNDSAFNSRLSTKSSLYKKAYIEAKIFPKPNLSHITTNQAVQPQSSKVQNNFFEPEKVISNKLKFKVNNSTMSTSANINGKKTLYHRTSWIIMDDDSEKMNLSPPPTISLNERFSNLPVNKKRDKEKGKHKKKQTRRISIPSNTWISIKKPKEDKRKQKRRAPKIDDDDDDNDQVQVPSIVVKDDSFSHSEYSTNGLNDNENNSGSIRSEPSILDDLDIITADIDDNLLVDCMLTDWSEMDFILDPNILDLPKLEESMMSE